VGRASGSDTERASGAFSSADDDSGAIDPSLRGALGIDGAKGFLRKLYLTESNRLDLYCGCAFSDQPGLGLRINLAACGYVPVKSQTRAERIEWEHAVPAATFGRTFVQWREGDPRCVDSQGVAYRGRECARKASPEFARMEADMHNLFPVVGEVNGLRDDMPMGASDARFGSPARSAPDSGALRASYTFGACESSIVDSTFRPRASVRGDIARAYKYMDATYPNRGIIQESQRAMFDAWDAADPPDAWERSRNEQIGAKQGNTNSFIDR